jgi:hypothetical protein
MELSGDWSFPLNRRFAGNRLKTTKDVDSIEKSAFFGRLAESWPVFEQVYGLGSDLSVLRIIKRGIKENLKPCIFCLRGENTCQQKKLSLRQ